MPEEDKIREKSKSMKVRTISEEKTRKKAILMKGEHAYL